VKKGYFSEEHINIFKDSWRISKARNESYHLAFFFDNYKPSIFERFQGWINGLILNRDMFTQNNIRST